MATKDIIEQSAVTKSKHPGRVAQGHKLAALMKQRKQELLQNKKPELSKELKPELQSVQDIKLSSPTVQCGLAILALAATAVGVYMLYMRKKAPEPEKSDVVPVRKTPRFSLK